MNANPAGSDLVLGAGVIGSRVARMLAEGGRRVSVVSRRGSGPAGGTRPSGVIYLAADAADAEAMARLAEGTAVIYNCVNPAYHRWPADWPPIPPACSAPRNAPARFWSRCPTCTATARRRVPWGPAPTTRRIR
jgi:hypothetical protein